MTLRTCLYARFSTDKQNERSIDDQLRAARERAEREGWHIVATHADEGVSGSTPVALRAGGKALLADALAGRFEILIVEGLDRLSRKLGEQEQVVERLEYRRIRIIGTSDGYDSQVKGRAVARGMRGIINSVYLDDLREKTHRGLAGQFDRGMSAGGKSFGYRTEESPRGRRLVIDEAEAVHVRWVFQRFAEGASVANIAHELNRRGVPSPRGKTWAVSGIRGSVVRGLGLLNNELYIGRVIWNRRQWLKDPETGKRTYVDRPESEWQVRDEPELRIIDEQTWRLVRQRLNVHHSTQASATRKGGRPARTLFGGLLRCPTCSGPVIAVNSDRYGCGVHKDRGPAVCPNGDTVGRDLLDKRLLAIVRDELTSPQALAELQDAVRTVLAEQQREAAGGLEGAKQRLRELTAEIDRLVDAVVSLGISDALSARLQRAEFERAALAQQLAAASPSQERARLGDVLARYRAKLMDLQKALDGQADRGRTRELLAQMIGPVTVVRGEDGATYAELDEPAARLLAIGDGVSNLGCGGRI